MCVCLCVCVTVVCVVCVLCEPVCGGIHMCGSCTVENGLQSQLGNKHISTFQISTRDRNNWCHKTGWHYST